MVVLYPIDCVTSVLSAQATRDFELPFAFDDES